MELQDLKKINDEMTETVIDEIKYMNSRTADLMEEQLILQTKLSNLLIMLRAENDREG